MALRRILSRVALKKPPLRPRRRITPRGPPTTCSSSPHYGEGVGRHIAFAHFSRPADRHDLPTLKVLGWDNLDTPLHLDAVARTLAEHLTWPDDEDDPAAWRERWRAAFTLRHQRGYHHLQSSSPSVWRRLARAIRDRTTTALAIESETGPLTKLMKAFQTALVHDLDEAGFADMYAQTIAYGLLSARITDPARRTADDFPTHMRTNPFLRELMQTFLQVGGRRAYAGGPGIDFDELGVSEVVELLDHANMDAVIRDFGDHNPRKTRSFTSTSTFSPPTTRNRRCDAASSTPPGRWSPTSCGPWTSCSARSSDSTTASPIPRRGARCHSVTGISLSRTAPHRTKHSFRSSTRPPAPALSWSRSSISSAGRWSRSGRPRGHGKKKIQTLWNDYVPKHLLPRLHGYELLMARTPSHTSRSGSSSSRPATASNPTNGHGYTSRMRWSLSATASSRSAFCRRWRMRPGRSTKSKRDKGLL